MSVMSSVQQNGSSNFSFSNNEVLTQNNLSRPDSSLHTPVVGSMQNGNADKFSPEVYLVQDNGSNSFSSKIVDDYSSSTVIYPSQQMQNSISTNNNAVQIQIINGQPTLQANFQQLQTPNGPITVAILPDLNALRPYFVQVQRPPLHPQSESPVQRQVAPKSYSTSTNGKCQNQKFLPIQPRLNGGFSSNPAKSSSPVLLPKATAGVTSQMHVVRTPVQGMLQTCQPQTQQPSMTIQLTAEDQQQISLLTEQLKKIVASNAVLSPENERLIEILQQKRSAILAKTFYQQQQQRSSFVIDQTMQPSNDQTTANFNTMTSGGSNSLPFAATQSGLPAQIVQINGMPYLAVASNSRSVPTTQVQQSFVYNETTRSQDTQRVFTPSTTFGLQLPVRPQLISGQCESTAGPSTSFAASSQCTIGLTCSTQVQRNGGRMTSSTNVNGDQSKSFRSKKLCDKHVENILGQVADDQYHITIPDCKTPFQSSSDAISRLLPYHIYNEPNVSKNFLDRVDESFKGKMNSLENQKSDLFRRFQSILLKESTVMHPKSEYCLINELISKTESDLLNEERKTACKSPDNFVRKLIKLKNKTINEKTPDVFNLEDSSDEMIPRFSSSQNDLIVEESFHTKEKSDEIGRRLSPDPQPAVKTLHCLYRDLKKIKKKAKHLNNGRNSSLDDVHHHRDERDISSLTNDAINEIVNEDRLKNCNEIPKLLLKINTAKRKCVVEESSPDAKRVPPLKIKLTKAPQTPQPLTRLSSLGLESSDEDETMMIDPLADRLNSSSNVNLSKPTIDVAVMKIFNDFEKKKSFEDIVETLNWPFINDDSSLNNCTFNKTIVSTDQRNEWDSRTAQFIRSKLKVTECLSPNGERKEIFITTESVKSLE